MFFSTIVSADPSNVKWYSEPFGGQATVTNSDGGSDDYDDDEEPINPPPNGFTWIIIFFISIILIFLIIERNKRMPIRVKRKNHK